MPFQIIIVVFVLILVALPFGLFSLVGWALHGCPMWSSAMRWIGMGLSLLVAIIFVVGFTWGWRQVTVTKYRYAHGAIPAAFDDYRIVQLSDFHIGTLSGHPEVVQNIVDSVNALKPDLIVFTGDLVNMKSEEETEFHEILRGMKAPDGVVSVMGNHDYMMYAYGHRRADGGKMSIVREQAEDIRRLQDAERDLGWHLLLNDHIVIRRGTDSIAIVGAENDGDGKHFPQYGQLEKAQDGLEPATFKILLSHDPTHWRRSVIPDTDIPLQLSGHTHAMQFKLFGWSPSSWFYPEWYGVYTYDPDPTTGASRRRDLQRTLIVSSGIGEVGVPFRFGALPEIVEISLRSR